MSLTNEDPHDNVSAICTEAAEAVRMLIRNAGFAEEIGFALFIIGRNDDRASAKGNVNKKETAEVLFSWLASNAEELGVNIQVV